MMLNIRLATFIAGVFGSATVIAGPACDVVTDQDVSIYYNNGMFSDRIEAKLAVMELQNQVRSTDVGSSVDPKISIAYSQPSNALDRIVNSAINQQDTDWAKILGWLFNDEISTPDAWFTEAIHSTTADFTVENYVNNAEIDFQSLQYRADILTGNKVILVAHGQGNFYANSAYDRLQERLAEEQVDGEEVSFSSFGIVSVASTGSRLESEVQGQDVQYVSLTTDQILLSLDSQRSILTPNVNSVGSTDWSGHLFLDSYLETDTAANSIVGLITQTVNAVTESQSQFRDGVLIDITLSWPLELARDVDLHIREPLAGPVGTDLQRFITVKHNEFEGNYGQLDVDAKDNFSIEHYTVECVDLEDQFNEDGRTEGKFEILVNYVDGDVPVPVDILVSAGDLVRSYENIVLNEVRDPTVPPWNADNFTIPVVDLTVNLENNQFTFTAEVESE